MRPSFPFRQRLPLRGSCRAYARLKELQIHHAANLGRRGGHHAQHGVVSAAVDRKGHAAARREIRVIGQLQRLSVVRHCAEAVQQRAAACRQVQGEH